MAPAGPLRAALSRVPAVHGALRRARAGWWAVRRPMAYPPGHYYSPEVSADDVRRQVFSLPETVDGVDLRAEAQLDLVVRLAEFHADQPFTRERTPGNRYFFENTYFSYGDAIVLHCLLRRLRPARLVEVGSGFSSAVVLDTNDRFLDRATEVTLIEPHPERLHALAGDLGTSGARVLASPVQDVDPAVFESLGPGDILFVDSSHVVKAGSDVQLLLLHVLPRLRPGVVVHFHDVFYPFEYPREWIDRGVSWNEAYALHAFLAFNTEFEILLFNSYLAACHREAAAAALPLWDRDPGSSLWLRRRHAQPAG